MRFVSIKSAEQKSVLVLHRFRDLLVRQRTMIVNTIRAHIAEFGVITAQGSHSSLGYIDKQLFVEFAANDNSEPYWNVRFRFTGFF